MLVFPDTRKSFPSYNLDYCYTGGGEKKSPATDTGY